MDAIERAEEFLWRNARLLERLRFEHLFRDGDPDAALRPYQRSDGGFGHALEPDFRGPISQPTTADSALRVLDEVGRLPDDVVRPLCDWLTTVTTDEGGVPMVLSSAAAYPRAPWWDPPEDQRASILPTSGLAGHLHRHRVDHPWLGPATEFTWRGLAEVPRRVAAGEWLVQLAYDVRRPGEGTAVITGDTYRGKRVTVPLRRGRRQLVLNLGHRLRAELPRGSSVCLAGSAVGWISP